MYQQGFHAVAGAVALGLGIDGDGLGHLCIGPGVDVNMAIAVEVLDDRYARPIDDEFDQAFATARDEHVHKIVHGEQGANGGAIAGGDELHGARGEAGLGDTFRHAVGDHAIGVQRFRPAAQNRGVARFQTQTRRVRRHVRTRLVNDAHHAQRHAHLADTNARGPG